MRIAASAPKARYQQETTGTRESQLEMVRRLELAPELHDDRKPVSWERRCLLICQVRPVPLL